MSKLVDDAAAHNSGQALNPTIEKQHVTATHLDEDVKVYEHGQDQQNEQAHATYEDELRGERRHHLGAVIADAEVLRRICVVQRTVAGGDAVPAESWRHHEDDERDGKSERDADG